MTVNYAQDAGTQPVESQPGAFDQFVAQVAEAAVRGYDLERLRLEFNLNSKDTDQRSPLEAAVMQQATRIVFETVNFTKGEPSQ